jgi:hypothetical protein
MLLGMGIRSLGTRVTFTLKHDQIDQSLIPGKSLEPKHSRNVSLHLGETPTSHSGPLFWESPPTLQGSQDWPYM